VARARNIKPGRLDAFTIARAMMAHRWRRNLTLPNYKPAGWWECDVFELTDAGYFREFEVKISRADFKIDQDKSRIDWSKVKAPGPAAAWPRLVKHDLLAAGDPRGPAQFWFVTPPGLISTAELPAWAGWFELDAGLIPRERRKAPRLHAAKCSTDVFRHARGVCYWRMHELIESGFGMPAERTFEFAEGI
jgi:hypothetical protein